MTDFADLPRPMRRQLRLLIRKGYCTQQQAEEAVATFLALYDQEEAGTLSRAQALRAVIELGLKHQRERNS